MRRLALGLLLLSACHRRPTADVSPIAAENESLGQNEQDLLHRRGMLQRERKKIADARARLIERRAQIGSDGAGRAALDQEEKLLFFREHDLTQQEAAVNAKLDSLLRLRGELVKRATQVVHEGADPLVQAVERERDVAGRERSLASREKELSSREKELSSRETTLARREAALAERERTTCAAVATPVKVELPRGLRYSAREVEPVYQRALKRMQERGLLASDLPPGSTRLLTETREAMKKGDFVRAKYDADQLLGTVEAIQIDRAFLSAKIGRLSAAMRGKKLQGDGQRGVEQLFEEATANYGDGKFPQANSKINRLFALLEAG